MFFVAQKHLIEKTCLYARVNFYLWTKFTIYVLLPGLRAFNEARDEKQNFTRSKYLQMRNKQVQMSFLLVFAQFFVVPAFCLLFVLFRMRKLLVVVIYCSDNAKMLFSML